MSNEHRQKQYGSEADKNNEQHAPNAEAVDGKSGETGARPNGLSEDGKGAEKANAFDAAAKEQSADSSPSFNADTSGYDTMVAPIDPSKLGSNLCEYESLEQFLKGDEDYASLPHPDVFNAYPPEVQRKIMEWTDRDVKARRDDESRRQDELTRARVERERRSQSFPTIIVVVAILCGAATGVVTQSPVFTLAFILVPIAVIVARLVGDELWGGKRRDPNDHKLPPRVQ